MKLQFKQQKFQADAARAVADVFDGQPYLTPSSRMEEGTGYYQRTLTEGADFTLWPNAELIPELGKDRILEQIRRVQKRNQITPSEELKGTYNLTIEMETGVGKTYTYIKTIYELNQRYGWSKFVVVVPSIAVREGVYQAFQMTGEHFSEEYGKKIRFFVYNSSRLSELSHFASDNAVHVMIINAQAFNAKGKDARRIYLRLDAFRSRRPIDVIAGTRPILIIDEPQSVEGKQTRESLKRFHPLMTLRYSATHRADSIYNMVYRLDAMEAYNRHLVKKIAVKGITETKAEAADGYVYLESLRLSKAAPKAVLQFDYRGLSGIRRQTRLAGVGFNLYEHSGSQGKLEEYRDGFVVKSIDGRDNSVEFLNGVKLYAGEMIGRADEEQIRRIQIRETILSHIERERALFKRGIKVLSLFFIDEVAHYRQYDADGGPVSGIFARMFEEEYTDILRFRQREIGEDAYEEYLDSISVTDTHAGYFSVDKKGRMTNSKLGDKREKTSDDKDAYDLIMKNKALLLEQDPEKSPVRFIFSHSALREGWDNPNVFQICTLKQSGSDVRRRQEVGRGLRLCVDRDGVRMDDTILGEQVHAVNVLTVIASESYESFARGLQSELAETVADRPVKVTQDLFRDRIVTDEKGKRFAVTADLALAIFVDLVQNGYVDRQGALTDLYYADRARQTVRVADEAAGFEPFVIEILDSVYNGRTLMPENAREKNIELRIDKEKLKSKVFRALWDSINTKSVYTVSFDTDDLVRRSIAALNSGLRVPEICLQVETGGMEEISSRDALLEGTAMIRETSVRYRVQEPNGSRIKYDLIGKLVEETGLTRKAMIQILTGMEKPVFDQFKKNPETFIMQAASLINSQKAAALTEHISYQALEEKYDTEVLTAAVIKGRPGVNVMRANKHLYDHIRYDSEGEKAFAGKLEASEEVLVYVKLPDGFSISTPMGRYTPDWAIAFRDGLAGQVYFVAETKGSDDSCQLRLMEAAKIHCAREHFKAISEGRVVYDVVDSYEALLEKIMK